MSHIETEKKIQVTEFDIEIENIADEDDSREEWIVGVTGKMPNGKWSNVGDEIEAISGLRMRNDWDCRADAKAFALKLADALKAKGFVVSGRIRG